ncbi:MAG: MFS transporter [Verrucomicrobia bacterium]|nr:MFS transporter [Verrucomicrobiota bacterium]
MLSNPTTRITFNLERRRAVTSGILETAGMTFLLLIAVRAFDAGPVAKALIAAGNSLGLLVSPAVVSTVASAGWRPGRAAAGLALTAFAVLTLMSVLDNILFFAVGSALAMTCVSSAVPLMTQVYQENYPPLFRGRLFSRAVMIRIAAAAVFSELAGRVMTGNIDKYPYLLIVFALASAYAAYCYFYLPSRPLSVSRGTHPFRALRYVKTDRLFRRTLIAWMIMGFANLMMFPLMVEYLANPVYEMNLSVAMIAWIVGVIPNAARFCMSPVWGRLFDHMNFFVLRISLNISFGIGVLMFFTSRNVASLIIAAVIFGCARAGGDVAWSLWVTKFAPARRVADYMSVHTFFTGVRGVIAPMVSFQLVAFLSMQTMGLINFSMICVSSVLLVPLIKFGRPRKHATALVEEISE